MYSVDRLPALVRLTYDVRSAVSWPRHGSMSIAVVVGWPPTCAYADMIRLKSNGAIPRREFVPAIRVGRISFDGACRVGRRGIRHYSRRLREGESRVRFPAYSAGRRLDDHSGDAHLLRKPSRGLREAHLTGRKRG